MIRIAIAHVPRSQPIRLYTTNNAKNSNHGAKIRTSEASSVIPSSEPPSVVRVDALSGVPAMIATQRRVTIFQPSCSATQSGSLANRHWRIEFDVANADGRWENPLMSWTSSSDALQALVLKFENKEAAIQFAERQGWTWQAKETKDPEIKAKSYAENFLYSKDPLKFIRTK